MLSLSPKERFKPSNMILHMIYETGLKPRQLAKYYDFAVQHELRDLYNRGLPGTQIKYVTCHTHTHAMLFLHTHPDYLQCDRSVFVFGSTMDLKGRMSFMNLKSETSYYGCCVCTHQFQTGLRTKCHFTGARRFLPRYNTLRNVTTHRHHNFIEEERRGPPTCTCCS